MKFVSISTIRAHAFCALLIVATAVSYNASAQSTNKPLTGVSKVATLISYNIKGAGPNGISEGRLRTILELKLRTHGLTVLSYDEIKKYPFNLPYVFLEVSMLETRITGGRSTGFAFMARLSVRIFASVPFNEARVPLEIWTSDTLAVDDPEAAASRTERVVNKLADLLVNDWLAANPRR
jgi:hypothetical protein